MRIILLCVVALLGLPQLASAKCAFAKYQVEGFIKTPQGVDPETVRIYLFLEGMSHTSDYPPDSDRADYATADPAGRFAVEAWLNTFSGRSFLTGDRCRRIAESADLVMIGPGIRAQRVEIRFRQNGARKLGARLEVPEIVLKPLE